MNGAVLLSAVALMPTAAPVPMPGEAALSVAATRICAGALLFEGRHTIGTRAGAVEVARDIRASMSRRLRRLAALPIPPGERPTFRRWMELERRLAAMYARNWVRIFDAIEDADTPSGHRREARLLRRLIDEPNALRAAAARLESVLGVPDCTGGGAPPTTP